jgi:hypothetical protein
MNNVPRVSLTSASRCLSPVCLQVVSTLAAHGLFQVLRSRGDIGVHGGQWRLLSRADKAATVWAGISGVVHITVDGTFALFSSHITPKEWFLKICKGLLPQLHHLSIYLSTPGCVVNTDLSLKTNTAFASSLRFRFDFARCNRPECGSHRLAVCERRLEHRGHRAHPGGGGGTRLPRLRLVALHAPAVSLLILLFLS